MDYVGRCYDNCNTAEQKDVMGEILGEQITAAALSDTYWKNDWLKEVVPASPASYNEARGEWEEKAATAIQAWWRGWLASRRRQGLAGAATARPRHAGEG
jgi:hypothetical protein